MLVGPTPSGSPSSVSTQRNPVTQRSALPSMAIGLTWNSNDDALFLGVVDLFDARRHLGAAAPVDDRRVCGAEAARRAHRVDGHVAATDHDHAVAVQHRRVGVGEGIGLHQVDAGQVLVRRVDAFQSLAGYAEEHRQPRTDRDEQGVEASRAVRRACRCARSPRCTRCGRRAPRGAAPRARRSRWASRNSGMPYDSTPPGRCSAS